MKMKKIIYSALAVCVVVLSGCNNLRYIPKAINTVNTIHFNELNLERQDYTILKNVSAEAVVSFKETLNSIQIKEQNGEFTVSYTWDKKAGRWELNNIDGIARFGFLTNDYDDTTIADNPSPEYFVRNIAIYRLINASKVAGGDGVIDPVISTNVEQQGKEVILRATISAKIIKIQPDK